MTKRVPALLMSSLLYWGISTMGIAQDTNPVQPSDASDPSLEVAEKNSVGTVRPISRPRPIEEITVVGQQSLFRLRRRIVEKEDEIFAFFNDNNSSDRMDILCSNRASTGTYIQRRVCEPRFFKEHRSFQARGFRQGFNSLYTNDDLLFEMQGNFDKLQNEMNALMLENEEFASKLADLADLTENYEAHRSEMFPKDEQ